MDFPIRCFTCTSPINHLLDKYEREMCENGGSSIEALKTIGIRRICCRRMFISFTSSDCGPPVVVIEQEGKRNIKRRK